MSSDDLLPMHDPITGTWDWTVDAAPPNAYVKGYTWSHPTFTGIIADSTLSGQEADCPGGCFNPGQRMIGHIDDMQIYDRALSLAEIQQLAGQYAP